MDTPVNFTSRLPPFSNNSREISPVCKYIIQIIRETLFLQLYTFDIIHNTYFRYATVTPLKSIFILTLVLRILHLNRP